jgi:hypothetical protein
MPQPKLTNEILIAALEGYEAQKTRIDAQIAEIRSMLGGGRTDTTPKRKVSASARRRMARAQKLRWKKIKQGSEAAQKPKRHMSASARKRIAAAQKKRWAAIKKETGAKKTSRKRAAPEQPTTAGA